MQITKPHNSLRRRRNKFTASGEFLSLSIIMSLAFYLGDVARSQKWTGAKKFPIKFANIDAEDTRFYTGADYFSTEEECKVMKTGTWHYIA